jgi:hypothetical protein
MAENKEQEVETKEKRVVKTEIYSRVVGYLRPVDSWNEAKQLEFRDRKTYNLTQATSSEWLSAASKEEQPVVKMPEEIIEV